MTTRPAADRDVSIPELMRRARGSSTRAIDAAYAARGIDDFPAQGGYLLSAHRERRGADPRDDGGPRNRDAGLERRLTADEITAMRRGLAALGEIKQSLPTS